MGVLTFIFSVLMLLIVLIVQLNTSDSPVWCGKPPKCKCFGRMKSIHCSDIQTLPEFKKTVEKVVKLMIITSPDLCTFPEELVNKSKYSSLHTLNVLKTCIDCNSVRLYQNRRKEMNIISKCKYVEEEETTVLHVRTGKPPAETESEEIWTTTNDTLFMVSQETTTRNSPWIVVNHWMDAGYILTAVNVIGAIILITIFVMKCRNQRTWRCFDKPLRQTEIQRRSIEDLGALSLSSMESVELYSRPSCSTLKRRSLERDIVIKSD